MLLQQTLDTLQELHLCGMIKALKEQDNISEVNTLSFEERFGLIVDREATEQANRKLNSRLKMARLRQNSAFEDFDWKTARGLNKAFLLELASCNWIRQNQNLLIIGATGVGKTFLGCALSHKACREGFSAFYQRMGRMFHDLSVARGDGRYLRLLKGLTKPDVLIIDDWGMASLSKEQRQDFLEIAEERHGQKSTIIISQIPVENWHGLIGEITLADAILDRLVHNAHIITLKGESMRKTMANNPKKEELPT